MTSKLQVEVQWYYSCAFPLRQRQSCWHLRAWIGGFEGEFGGVASDGKGWPSGDLATIEEKNQGERNRRKERMRIE